MIRGIHYFSAEVKPKLMSSQGAALMYPSKFVMHVANDQFSVKLNNSLKIFIVIFLHFTSIILLCWRNNFKFNNGGGLLSCVLLLVINLSTSYLPNKFLKAPLSWFLPGCVGP